MTFLKVPPNLPMFPRILCKYSKDALPRRWLLIPFNGSLVTQSRGGVVYGISIGIWMEFSMGFWDDIMEIHGIYHPFEKKNTNWCGLLATGCRSWLPNREAGKAFQRRPVFLSEHDIPVGFLFNTSFFWYDFMWCLRQSHQTVVKSSVGRRQWQEWLLNKLNIITDYHGSS